MRHPRATKRRKQQKTKVHHISLGDFVEVKGHLMAVGSLEMSLDNMSLQAYTMDEKMKRTTKRRQRDGEID